MSLSPEQRLAEFASTLQFEEIPAPVVRRCEDADAGLVRLGARRQRHAARSRRSKPSPRQWARDGPIGGAGQPQVDFAAVRSDGQRRLFACRRAGRRSQRLGVSSCGGRVSARRLPSRRRSGLPGRTFTAACVVGYEVGIRVGEFLGQPHYKVFHTTGTAGSLAAGGGGRQAACASSPIKC